MKMKQMHRHTHVRTHTPRNDDSLNVYRWHHWRPQRRPVLYRGVVDDDDEEEEVVVGNSIEKMRENKNGFTVRCWKMNVMRKTEKK